MQMVRMRCAAALLGATSCLVSQTGPDGRTKALLDAILADDEGRAISLLKAIPKAELSEEDAQDCMREAWDRGEVKLAALLLTRAQLPPMEPGERDGAMADLVGGGLPLVSIRFLRTAYDLPVNAKAPDGRTPLQVAAAKGDPALIRYLLDAGARATPETWMAALDKPLSLEALLKDHRAVLPSEAQTRFWLCKAVLLSGEERLIAIGLLRGFKPAAAGPGGRTLLHEARTAEQVRMLVRRFHLDLNARASLGIPNIDDPDPWLSGMLTHTPLNVGAHAGNLEVVRALLELGADPRIKDEEGRQPLAYATDPGVFDELLDHGEDPWLKDASGCSPIQRAWTRSPDLIARFLDRGNAFTPEAKADVIRGAAPELFRELVARKVVDPEATYPGIGMAAAFLLRQRPRDVEALMPGSWDLVVDPDRNNALHLLVLGPFADWPEVQGLMRKVRCPVDGLNAAGETPLILAVRMRHPSALKTLIERGADPKARDLQGKTALDWARELREGIDGASARETFDAEMAPLLQASAVHGK